MVSQIMNERNDSKKILLGITGGIAVYKSCELVRQLVGKGYEVHVVMTKAATQFVTPLTFQALSHNAVRTELFSLTEESEMGHIHLADFPDLILIAPTTADFIARVAHGFCDDLLTTLLSVTRKPVWMAPAMNVHMYEHPPTQKNIKTLQEIGYQILGPASGSLACGYEGLGRMEEPATVVDAVEKFFKKN